MHIFLEKYDIIIKSCLKLFFVKLSTESILMSTLLVLVDVSFCC